MPYYVVGDYYGRGDYYVGDGIFGSIGRALKGAARVVGGTLTGAVGGFISKGPLGIVPGAITGTVGAVVPAVRQGITEETLAAGGSQSALTPELIAQHQAAVARGARPQVLLAAPPGAAAPPPTTFGGHPILMAGTRRRRRMNVTNPRALRKAIRRARGFAKLARKVMTFVDAKAPKGRAKFKTRKR